MTHTKELTAAKTAAGPQSCSKPKFETRMVLRWLLVLVGAVRIDYRAKKMPTITLKHNFLQIFQTWDDNCIFQL